MKLSPKAVVRSFTSTIPDKNPANQSQLQKIIQKQVNEPAGWQTYFEAFELDDTYVSREAESS